MGKQVPPGMYLNLPVVRAMERDRRKAAQRPTLLSRCCEAPMLGEPDTEGWGRCKACGEMAMFERREDMTTQKPKAALFDVIAVNIKTGIISIMGEGKDARNAEAVILMAVMRRGVNEDFYVDVPAGTYKDGDTFKGEGG